MKEDILRKLQELREDDLAAMEFAAGRCVDMITAYCNIAEVPEELLGVSVSLAEMVLDDAGGTAKAKSIREGDVSVTFAEGVSADVLRLWHLAGLLSAVIFHILLGLGHRSSMSLEKAQEKSMSCKKDFNLALERFKSDHGQWLAADPVLAKKLLSLFESIRFSSESTPAAAECDQEIFESFQQLQKVENVKEALEKIEKISSQVAFRNQVIKASR